MATGYIVSGRGDLDALFKPRTSAAGANTGFKSNGGIDLAQRFEPRAATTAIANTNFKSGATDLAQLFKDIAAGGSGVTNHSLLAGVDGTGLITGYQGGGYGTFSPIAAGSLNVFQISTSNTGNITVWLYGASTPPDTDASLYSVQLYGYIGLPTDAVVTQTFSRATRSATGTATVLGTQPARWWRWDGVAGPFVNGTNYSTTIVRN